MTNCPFKELRFNMCDPSCALMTEYGVCAFIRMLSVMENNGKYLKGSLANVS